MDAPVGSGNDESREDSRAPVVLRVEYKRLNSFIADYTKNISRGGTFIHTDKPLAVGAEFIFVFIMPDAVNIPPRTEALEEAPPTSRPTSRRLAMRGRVRWVKTAPSEEAGMGIEFVFADDSERESVRAFVKTVMLEALGPVLAEKILRARKAAPPRT